MHPIFLLHLLAATSSRRTSSGSSFLIFIIPLLIIAYLLIFRPQQRRAQRQRQAQSAIEEGDWVATIGGVVGRVVALDGDRATVEVADGIEMEFLRQAVARRIDPPAEADAETEPDEEPDEDEDRGWHGYHPDGPEEADDTHDIQGEDEPDEETHVPGPVAGNGAGVGDGAGAASGDSRPAPGGGRRSSRGAKGGRSGGGADLGRVFGVSSGPAEAGDKEAGEATTAEPRSE